MSSGDEHFDLATHLLEDRAVWNGSQYVQTPPTHEAQRRASIHSNLAKIHVMQTQALIDYAKLLPAVPEYLFREVAQRLGISEPDADSPEEGTTDD